MFRLFTNSALEDAIAPNAANEAEPPWTTQGQSISEVTKADENHAGLRRYWGLLQRRI